MLFLCNIANVAERTFNIVQTLRSREHGDISNYIDKNVERMSTARVYGMPFVTKLNHDARM